MLKINNVSIAVPSAFQVDIQDIDGESNRNAKGELLRDRIAVKRKLNCEWPPSVSYTHLDVYKRQLQEQLRKVKLK